MLSTSIINNKNKSIILNEYEITKEKVVIMAHGFMSNKDSKGRFPRLAEALNTNNVSVISFDFTGCGESEDEVITVEQHLHDMKSVIGYAKEKGYKRIGLFGHSLGSLIALKSYCSDVHTIVLTGALTGPMYYNWTEYFTELQLSEIEKAGFTYEHVDDVWRSKIEFNQQTLDDFKGINQEELLSPVSCPVLIIHGDLDQEERDLYQHSIKAMSYLNSESELQVIEGATHSFLEKYDLVIQKVTTWYSRHL